MASVIFDSCLHDERAGNINFESDAFAVMLVTSSYVPNRATHTKRSDVTNEVTGTGYTANGETAAVTLEALDTGNHRQDLTLEGHDWLTSTITARGAVYYKDRGGLASADELVAYIDFGSNVTTSGNTFSLTDSTLRTAG